MTALKIIRYTVWASIVLLGALVAFVLLNPSQKGEQASGGRIGGVFSVAMAKGGVLDSATLKGRPYAVFFGFTQCPDICPGTLSDLTALFDDLDKGNLAMQAKEFRVYFITVDPERDTGEVLTSYLSAFDNRVAGLVPTVANLPALTKQFAAFYQKVPTTSGYTMNHTSAVYLFNKDGIFAGTIDTQESKANQKSKLERLLSSQ